MKLSLSEDWLATIIGLAIVAVVALGLIGPGPQNVTVRAEPGETGSAQVVRVDNVRVTGRIGEETVPIEGASNTYIYRCNEQLVRSMTVQEYMNYNPTTSTLISEDRSNTVAILFINDCDQPASITYRTDAAVRFPLFNLFGR